MNVRLTLPFLAALVLAVPSWANEKTIRKEITAEYAKYDKAVLKGMGGLAAWCSAKLAPDFTMVEQGGKTTTRKEFMNLLNQMAKQKNGDWKGAKEQKTSVEKLTMDGSSPVALITTKGTFMTTDSRGQFGPKGKDHEMTLTRKYRETWTKIAGTWNVKKSEELGGSMLVDGKPLGGRKQ
jgi:hypothetical protein